MLQASRPSPTAKSSSSLVLWVFLLAGVAVALWLLYPSLLAASHVSSSTALPQTAQTAPHTAAEYKTLARKVAQEAGIDSTVFVRQINQESGFNPQAVSSAGAIGIAQFMPETAKGLGVDPNDPVSSLKVAAKLMAALYHGYGGSYAKALAAYNAGAHRVNEAIANGGANWLALLPSETQNYVRIILSGTGES